MEKLSAATIADEYRFFYIKGRGPAELVRYLLVYSGRPFQDCRLTLHQWRQIRGEDKRIVLPLLEVDGKEVLSGSVPISLFLANKLGLVGSTKEEEALVSQVVEAIGELQGKLNHVIRAVLGRRDDIRRVEWAVFTHRYLGPFLAEAESLLPNTKSWLIGGQLTLADLAVGEFLGRMEECFDSNTLRDSPKLKRLVERVEDLPRIADWVARRPHSLF